MGVQFVVGAMLTIAPIVFVFVYKLKRRLIQGQLFVLETWSILLSVFSAFLIFLLAKYHIRDNYIDFSGVIAYLECFFIGIFEFINKRKKSLDNINLFYVLFYSSFPFLEISILLLAIKTEGGGNVAGDIMTATSIIIGVVGNVFLLNFLILQNSKEFWTKRKRDIDLLENEQCELVQKAEYKTDLVQNYLAEYREGISKIHEMISLGNIEDAKKILFEDMESLTNYGTESLCENTYVNAIVSAKKRLCKEKGIKTSFSIEVPRDVRIDSLDICTVIGNVLDNAINACVASKIKEKNIDMFVGMQGEYLVLKESNTADRYSQVVDNRRKHYGKKIIKEHVDYYFGTVSSEWDRKSNIYEVFIMMLQRGKENDFY